MPKLTVRTQIAFYQGVIEHVHKVNHSKNIPLCSPRETPNLDFSIHQLIFPHLTFCCSILFSLPLLSTSAMALNSTEHCLALAITSLIYTKNREGEMFPEEKRKHKACVKTKGRLGYLGNKQRSSRSLLTLLLCLVW